MTTPKPIRRNPDLVGDVLIIGAILLGMGALLPLINKNAASQFNQAANNAGYNAGYAAGSAVAGAITGAGNSILLQGQDMCSLIQGWRNQGAPAICYVANFPIIPDICSGGGDPNDWGTFRSYLRNSGFVDPGPNPPSCW